jgi:hypothetical protein
MQILNNFMSCANGTANMMFEVGMESSAQHHALNNRACRTSPPADKLDDPSDLHG